MKHKKNRVEALSDAVFAFAATLMAVNLGSESNIMLNLDFTVLISFAISFFTIILIWKVHYNFFRRTKYTDNWIIAFNMILLFTMLFYVFPLKSLTFAALNKITMSYNDLSNLFLMYSSGFLIIFLSITLMYYRAYKIDKRTTYSIDLLFYSRHFTIFIIFGLISIIFSAFGIGISYGLPGIVYSFIGIPCYIHAKRFYKKHKTIE